MALKLPSWFWMAVYAAQNAITALLGLKSAGVLEKKSGAPEEFQGSVDKKPGE